MGPIFRFVNYAWAKSRVKQSAYKDNPEVLNSALNAIKNKYSDHGVSVDGTELAAALIVAVPKDYLSSIKIHNGWWSEMGCQLLLKRC